jgi:hypothetical protein
MRPYKTSSHTVHDLKVHLIWITAKDGHVNKITFSSIDIRHPHAKEPDENNVLTAATKLEKLGSQFDKPRSGLCNDLSLLKRANTGCEISGEILGFIA